MDAIDEAILRELTADGRLPYRELGARVGLSANAAAARVRLLLADGVIAGFHGGARADRAALVGRARGVHRGASGGTDDE
ncbi:MAG: AsnC family transcriptional regulator [Cellulomonas sp.]|nr:AsnC family transcriptional regulator [Cellulomonas sp.]MCR6648709.1 AsnC family transcriptional regulator [Cellulomonas sp.]